MSLRDEIRSAYQKMTLIVKVAGRVVTDVVGADDSSGFDQINSQATLHCTRRPAWAQELASVEIWRGHNGLTARTFKGEIAAHVWSYSPAGVGVDCRDKLARLRNPWALSERTYTSQDDAAVVRNLLEAYGIPSSEANIESSGWTLGTIEDVVLRSGDVAWSLIAEIDELAGYRTFTMPSGVIVRRRISGSPAPSGIWYFARGVDIMDGAQRHRTTDGIINHAIIRGLTYEGSDVVGEASAPNPYLPDPPGEIVYDKQSNLVETIGKALDIAQRIVGDYNRRPEYLEFSTLGNPLIVPSATIGVDHSDLEASGALVLVQHVSHSSSERGYITTIRTTGGNLSGYNASAPIADFNLALYLESEDTGTPPPAQRIIGIADGTTSFDPDGEESELSYAWTVTPDSGTATPSSGSGSILRFILTGAPTEVTVDLIVTDVDSNTAELSLTSPIDPEALPVEAIWAAAGATLYYSGDGQKTWNSQTTPLSATATCLAPFAPGWGQVFGASNGHIYASFDGLVSTPVDLGAPHGAVACTAVWVQEEDTTRLWAGFADGKVYFGAIDTAAQTAAFTLQGTVPASPINEIRESVGSLGELRATAGEAEYYSPDAGATWTIGVAGATGSTAWRMGAGFDTNAVGLLTDSTPIRYEVGANPTVPGGISSIRGLTFGFLDKELYAADDSDPARLLRSNTALTTLTEVGSAIGLAQINHMIRSSSEPGIIYLAGGDGAASNAGVIKWLVGTDAPWYALRTGTAQCYMVGYGTPVDAQVVLIGHVLIPTWGVSGARDGIWRIQNGVATQITPPQAGWFWWEVSVNPFNTQQLLLLGNNYDNGGVFIERTFAIVAGELRANNGTDTPLYYSSDGGATWSAVILTVPSFPSGTPSYAWFKHGAIWDSRVDGNWVLVGDTGRPFYGEVGTVWRGSGGSQTSYLNLTSPQATWLYASASGIAGETVIGGAFEQVSGYLSRSASSIALPGGNDTFTSIDRFPGTSRAIIAAGANLHYNGDYRTNGYANIAGGQHTHACAMANNDILVMDSGTTLFHVTDVSGTPLTTTVSSACTTVASGRVTHRVAAACVSGIELPVPELVLWFYDGVAWQQIPTPLRITDVHVFTQIAVVETP